MIVPSLKNFNMLNRYETYYELPQRPRAASKRDPRAAMPKAKPPEHFGFPVESIPVRGRQGACLIMIRFGDTARPIWRMVGHHPHLSHSSGSNSTGVSVPDVHQWISSQSFLDDFFVISQNWILKAKNAVETSPSPSIPMQTIEGAELPKLKRQ